MQEMDELYKDCPMHTNTYEVDGVKHKVVSHFVGDRDINDVNSSFLPNGSTAVNLNERSIESGILKKYDLNESCLQDLLQGRCDYDAGDSGLI